ncbi:MAG: hypothetical protein IPJ81_18925 [Chitinophagaceae bacterium]|nr:hypothetical protein [Chitinophagaceae bacterium]
MLTFNYALTQQDFVNYSIYVNWDAEENRKKKIIFLARQAFVSIVIFILLITSDIFKMYGDFRYAFYFLYFGLIIFSSFRIRHRYINAAKQFAVNPSNSSYFIQKEIIFSETGVSLKDNLSDSVFRWKSFIKNMKTKRIIFYSQVQYKHLLFLNE